MLDILHEVEANILRLIHTEKWNTLYIDYENPTVERLWIPYKDFRVSLHKIHPCEKPLVHPHPWPQAIRVLSGHYEMGVGFADHDRWEDPPTNLVKMRVDTSVLSSEGFVYEMLDRNGWHYVKPLGTEFVYSLMVTGAPWGRATPKSNKPLRPLTAAEACSIKQFFIDHYTYHQKETYIVILDWPAGNPTLADVASLMEFSGVELDKTFGLHQIDSWLQKYLIQVYATPYAKAEAEAMGGMEFRKRAKNETSNS